MISELRFYLKKYKLLAFFFYVQTTLFFLMIGTFIIFMDQLNYESKSLQNIYEGKAIYQLLDNYYEGSKYAEFTSQPDYLIRLKKYYIELNTAEDFQYLAMFNHHILLKDEDIHPRFIYNYEQGKQAYQRELENEEFITIKSFQLNKQVIDFFDLNVTEGILLDEEHFKYSSEVMPVLLGSSYREFYEVGDEINIIYYFKSIPVKVIGFLEENSKVYFANQPEFYLDNYILLPYIEYNDPLTGVDEKFQQINYFARINGYVVTDDNPIATQSLFPKIDAIANKASISYSYIGMNPHFHQYRGLMTVLIENKVLVQSIFIFSSVLYFIIINIILLLQQKRRLSFFAIHFINGATKFKLVKMLWAEIGTSLFAGYITSCIIFSQILIIGNLRVYLYLLLTCITMIIISTLFPAYKLLTKPFDFHNEDKGENL